MKRFVLGATFLLATCTASHAGFTQAQLGAVYADAKPNAQLPLEQGFIDETAKKTTLRAVIDNRPAVVRLRRLHLYERCAARFSPLPPPAWKRPASPPDATFA